MLSLLSEQTRVRRAHLSYLRERAVGGGGCFCAPCWFSLRWTGAVTTDKPAGKRGGEKTVSSLPARLSRSQDESVKS